MMPDQPMSEVRTASEAAVVLMMSSVVLPTRMMSAWVQMLNQISRQAMSPASEYSENCGRYGQYALEYTRHVR